MQTFAALVCIRCQYALQFLKKSRGRGVKALDNQNSVFVAEKLNLKRCIRPVCSFGNHLTLRPVPGLLLQSPGQCTPKGCAWLILQNLRNITRVTSEVVRSSSPS